MTNATSTEKTATTDHPNETTNTTNSGPAANSAPAVNRSAAEPHGVVVERRGPTALSAVLGVLLVLGGVFLLGNAVLATALSTILIGWTALLGGIAMVVYALVNTGTDSFWLGLISGVILAVLGLVVVLQPGLGVVTLTMMAGAGFLAGGVTRLVLAATMRTGRGWLIVGGIVSLLLGVFVLANFVEATFTLLGVIVGVSMLMDGIAMIAGGRTTVARI